MKKTVLMSIMMMLSVGFFFTSCNSDDDEVVIIPSTSLKLEIPSNLENVVLSNASATITHVQTQQTVQVTGDQFVKRGNSYQLEVSFLINKSII